MIDALRNAWGGGDIIWLSPDKAAEFMVQTRLSNEADVWASLQVQGVDMIVQPAKERRKAVLLADMDSTMIEQECIDELAEELGVGPRVAEITARAMNGEIDFDGALLERVGLMAGQDAKIITHVLKTRISYMPGGQTLVSTMKANGGYCALVSGGFTDFTGPVASYLGFDENRANEFIMKDGQFSGDVTRPILGREAKVVALNEITSARDLTTADVIAVGDGANDLGMLQLAGTGVALHAKPSVQAQAKHRINHCDLTALLFIQGYSSDEFQDA